MQKVALCMVIRPCAYFNIAAVKVYMLIRWGLEIIVLQFKGSVTRAGQVIKQSLHTMTCK